MDLCIACAYCDTFVSANKIIDLLIDWINMIDIIFPLSPQGDGVPEEDVELDILRRQLEAVGSLGSNATILAEIELIEQVPLAYLCKCSGIVNDLTE